MIRRAYHNISLFGAIANYYFTSVSFIIICYVWAVFRHKSTCIGFHGWVVTTDRVLMEGRNKPKAGENFNLCSWCCYGYLELTLFWFWEKNREEHAMNVKCTYTFRFWFVGIRKKEHYQIVHDFFDWLTTWGLVVLCGIFTNQPCRSLGQYYSASHQ